MSELLPKLKTGHHLGVIAHGKWNEMQEDFLSDLGEGLLLSEPGSIGKKTYSVSSIPTPWARAILFTTALLDDKHPLHPQVRSEWRGMLALLALHKWLPGVRLEANTIELQEQGVYDFEKVLHTLLPRRALKGDVGWNKLTIFSVNGEAVGMTSPTTLVVMREDTPKNFPPAVNWLNTHEDPVRLLKETQIPLFKGWIEQIKVYLGNPGLELDQVLFGLFSPQLAKLSDALGAQPQTPPETTESNGINYGIYACMDKPIKAPAKLPPGPNTMTRLKSLRGNAAGIKPLYLIDSQIAEQWQMAAKEINVFHIYDLAALISPTLLQHGRHRLGNDTLPENGEWRKGEEFFTDKLFVIQRGDAFDQVRMPQGANITHSGMPASPILPIHPELLNYLTPEELEARTTFTASGDNSSYTVTIRIPLEGGDYSISKTYSMVKEQVKTIADVPLIQLWPNFVNPDWHHYVLIYARAAETFLAEPFAFGIEPKLQNIAKKLPGDFTTWVATTAAPPEALFCRYRDEEAGLLLIQKPPRNEGTEANIWKIGVDFGTTRTNIYVSKDGGNPKPMKFSQRYFPITKTDRNIMGFALEILFTNPEEIEWPKLSAFFPHLLNEEYERPFQAILDGNFSYIHPNTGLPFISKLKFDLKWSPDRIDRKWMRILLEQICIQCIAEAAGCGATGVQFFWSYPSAFSNDTTEQLKTSWDSIFENLGKYFTGVIPPHNEDAHLEEAIAAARYFAQDEDCETYFNQGAVCIDVGGATSDISIWQKAKPLYQASLRFAGREIFVDVLKRFLDELLKIFESKTSINVLQDSQKDNDPRKFRERVEIVLEQDGINWQKNLNNYIGHQEVKDFINVLSFGTGALFYYVGLMLRDLKKQGKYKDEEIAHVYIAGNGARIFDWLAGGKFRKDSTIQKVLQGIFESASGLRMTAKQKALITLSGIPKSEAAYGLVGDPRNLNETIEASEGLIAGENYRNNETDQPGNWDSVLENDSFLAVLEVDPSLPQVQGYVNAYNAAIAAAKSKDLKRVKLEEADRHEICQFINQDLINKCNTARDDDPRKVVVEPIFLKAVGKFVQSLARQYTQKD